MTERKMLSACGICFGLLSACHNDISVEETDSATGDCEFFPGPACSTSGSTEAVPTTTEDVPTSSGDETGEPINPSEFCTLHPDEQYGGFVWVCSGEGKASIRFDYYGDASLGLETVMACIDLTVAPYTEVKDVGYVYTCFRDLIDYEFGPDSEEPNGQQIDACCLRDSPPEAIEAYCSVDAGEKLCGGISDGINEFRAQIPAVPSTVDLRDQLEAWNLYLADSLTQSACANQIATDILANAAVPKWQSANDNSWSWFREIWVTVPTFSVESSENSSTMCVEVDAFTSMAGPIVGGELLVKSYLGDANASVKEGSFSLRHTPCELETCDFTVETFDFALDDFQIGSLSFSDIHVEMKASATGKIHGDAIGFKGGEMRFVAKFLLALEGEPQFDGEHILVDLSNAGVAEAMLGPGPSFSVKKLNAMNWPFELQLATEFSAYK